MILAPTAVSLFGGLFRRVKALSSFAAISLISCVVYSAGQVIGQFAIQWVCDLLGRKNALYGFTLILTVVSMSQACNRAALIWNLGQAALVETFSKFWFVKVFAPVYPNLTIRVSQVCLRNRQVDWRYRNWRCAGYSARGQLRDGVPASLRF